MDANLPLGVMLFDYALGAIMWTLVGRFGMSIFLPENSNFFFMRMFVKVTDPMIRIFKPITPGFLIDRLKASLCGLVHFHVPVLCLAAHAGLQHDGGSVLPAGRRYCQSYL